MGAKTPFRRYAGADHQSFPGRDRIGPQRFYDADLLQHGLQALYAAASVQTFLADQPNRAQGRGLYALLQGHHAAQGHEAHGLQAGRGGHHRRKLHL